MSSYKVECKQCGGNNFYITEWNMLGYCFNCGYTEYQNKSREDIVLRRSNNLQEIRNIYKRMAMYYHSCLDKHSSDYLYTRGYTDATIQKLCIGYCPDDQSILYRNDIIKEAGLATHDGKAFLHNRITFPYISLTGDITDIRGRDITGNDELKYKSPHGSTYFRGADYPYNYFLYKSDTIIITEGEVKAGIAYQYGYDTMALPGMGSWRKGFKPRAEQKIIILFDTQDSDIYNIRRAIKRTANNIDNVYVATLPDMNTNKMDLDTFLVQYPLLFPVVLNAALPYVQWQRYNI
jgi:DNA primase